MSAETGNIPVESILDDRANFDEAIRTRADVDAPTAYPQIHKFLPQLIDAVALDSIDSEQNVLEDLEFRGAWLRDRPRTSRLPEVEVPLDVVTTSWGPYVLDRDDDPVGLSR